MFHRDTFLLSLLHLSLLSCSLVQAGDPKKNPDTVIRESNGNWTGQLPDGHTTQMTPSIDMPKGPEITPNFNQPNPSPSSNSSAGGILGFLWNLGKTSDKDRRIADQLRARDIAEKKSLAGIPWDSADYASTGTVDLSQVRNDPSWAVNFAKNTAAKAAPVIVTPSPVVSTPAPTTTAAVVTTPLPTSTYTSPGSNSIMPAVGKGGIPCWPQFGEGGMEGVVQPTEIASTIANIKAPKLPSLPGNKPGFPSIGGDGGGLPPMVGGMVPFPKVPRGPSGGDIASGIGGVAGGAGLLIQAGGATTGGATVGGATVGGGVAGGTAGGGAVVTGGGAATVGWGTWFMTSVLPPVAIVGGTAVTSLAILDYVFPNEHNVFFKGRYQDKLKREAANKAQTDKSVGQGSSGGPNPKKPDDDKKERAEKIKDHKRWTNKEAREQAKALNKGFEEKKNPPGDIKNIGFTDGKKWISPDIDGHNGGVWKEFNLKGQRTATLDKFLNRIKS